MEPGLKFAVRLLEDAGIAGGVVVVDDGDELERLGRRHHREARHVRHGGRRVGGGEGGAVITW